MTLYEQPPIVDLDELLDEQEDQAQGATRAQWALVVVGGVAGIAGLLAVLVAAAPAIIDLVAWINSIQQAIAP
jgi:hypothetical protein